MKKIILFCCFSFLTVWATQAQKVNRLTGPKAKNQKYFCVHKSDDSIKGGIAKGIDIPSSRKIETYRKRRLSYQYSAKKKNSFAERRSRLQGPKAKNFKPWKN